MNTGAGGFRLAIISWRTANLILYHNGWQCQSAWPVASGENHDDAETKERVEPTDAVREAVGAGAPDSRTTAASE
jgi:hypothetical protein